jgi:hypothetical protein
MMTNLGLANLKLNFLSYNNWDLISVDSNEVTLRKKEY